MENIKIAILGMGNIGTGLYKAVSINENKIQNYLGKKIEIKRILVRELEKERDVDISKEIITTNIREIIEDPEIEIVVELIGGINLAYEYIKESIKHKKHVVTANKAVIAMYGKELDDLAKEHGVELRFEGSVGGGIPIINTISESLAGNEIEEMIGIINGTTNFILTQMSDYGMEFDEALKLAQEKGYAEADPTSDLEGEDAAFKLSILSNVAFGESVKPHEVPREGIKKISQEDIKYADELGYKIKLLALAKKYDNHIELQVHPGLVSKNHPLSTVKNEFNALFIRGNAVGEIMLYGKGAGSLPTGSAVLGDVLSIGKLMDNKSDKDLIKESKKSLEISNGRESQYYIRLEVVDEPGVLGSIAVCFGKYGISLESVVQRGRGKRTAPLVFITHDTSREKLDNALRDLETNLAVAKIASILKVENLD